MIVDTVIPSTPIATMPLRIAPYKTREAAHIIDHDRQYIPALVTYAEHQLLQSAGFSLAAMGVDAGQKLQRLVGFIRQMSAANPSSGYIPCSYKIVEQIAYLSCWKDLTVEFWLEAVGNTLVVTARFPREPELTCILNLFPGDDDTVMPNGEIQNWFEFLCQVVREHAPIWQIHLIMTRSIMAKLTPLSGRPDVLLRSRTDD